MDADNDPTSAAIREMAGQLGILADAETATAAGRRPTRLYPRVFNDARLIGEEYRAGVPVIVDLTGADDHDAKRIIDFCAGLVFGLRGTIERVTNRVYLLSPSALLGPDSQK